MEIKRKLVGTQEELIEYLVDAQKAMQIVNQEMQGHRDDTRIKRANRDGYIEGLEFAIEALSDWENSDDTSQSVRGVPHAQAGRAPEEAGAVRNESSGRTSPASR